MKERSADFDVQANGLRIQLEVVVVVVVEPSSKTTCSTTVVLG